MLANESMQIFTYLANKIKYDKNKKNNVQPINSANYSVQTAYLPNIEVWRCNLKDFFTRFSKQVLLFEICGFKNCKIESEFVNISVGHCMNKGVFYNKCTEVPIPKGIKVQVIKKQDS